MPIPLSAALPLVRDRPFAQIHASSSRRCEDHDEARETTIRLGVVLV
jgi:hypothetical protein